MTREERLCQLKLSLQRALAGAVSSNVCAVSSGIVESRILITAFYYQPPSEEEQEDLSAVATEVIADFPEPYTVDTSVYSVQEKPPTMIDFWAFMRKKE